MATITTLPTEVINEIVKYLPRASQARLMGVCRLLRSVCSKQVYNNVAFTSVSSMLLFCDIVARNEAVCPEVRTLSFRLTGDDDDLDSEDLISLSSSQKRVLRGTIRLLTPHVVKLEINNIPIDSPDIASCVLSHFPQLSMFQTALNSASLDFIHRHANRLLELNVIGSPYQRLTSRRKLPIKLPNVRQVLSNTSLVPLFLPGPNLTTLSFLVDPECDEEMMLNAFKAAGSWECQITTMVFTSSWDWIPEWLLEPTPRFLPHITDLTLVLSLEDELAVYSAIEGILPHMKNLQQISINLKDTLDPDEYIYPLADEYLNNEVERLQLWGNLSGTLQRYHFWSSGITWMQVKVKDTRLWIPTCLSSRSFLASQLWMCQSPYYGKLLESASNSAEEAADLYTRLLILFDRLENVY